MTEAADNVASSARWYAEKKGEAHVSLLGVFRVVYDEAAWRIDAHEYHAGLYASSEAPGVRGHSKRGYSYGPATLPYNVTRGAVDTLVSKVAQHRPLPQVLTQRGTWKNQKRARKMTQFLEGEFYRQRIFEKHAPTIVRDAAIFGAGILKVWTDRDRILTERGYAWEYFVDEWDARYGEPQNLYQLRSMDQGVAIERFARTPDGGIKPKVRDAIKQAGTLDIDTSYQKEITSTVKRVDVLEAWHLASGPNAGDGRHVVAVQGATLSDDEWEHDHFPIAVLGYNAALTGYWPTGLVEQLEGYQYEINLASEKASAQFRMSGKLIINYDGSEVHDQEFRNGISILHCKPGMRPDVFDMDLMNEHARARPRELTQDALNDVGLSQMSVQSQKPAGITAAVALQTLDDIETQRFVVFGRAYEAWCLDVARLFIGCAKQIAADYGDYAVSVPMKGGLLELSWNDVVVDGVEIRVFPTSLLPQQLAARLDRLKDLWNTGLIDRATFLRHLDAPDMQAELDLETADRLVIDEILERMLDADEEEGESAYIPPSAYQQLVATDDKGNPILVGGKPAPGWAPKRCQQKLNRAILDGADEYNLDLLRRYLQHCDVEIQKMAGAQGAANATQLAPAPMPNAGGAPAAPAPMPPPGAPPMAA